MESGFISIYRCLTTHHIFEGNMERLGAWVWLLSKACWKQTKQNVRGKTVILERGQLCASRSQLSNVFNWSDSAVERFLTRLETEQMIGRETGQGRTVITICNYEKFQLGFAEAGQKLDSEPDRNRTAKEKGNKNNKEPKGSIPPIVPQPEAVSDQVWNDFKAHRQAKKAKITETVMKGIEREAKKAGWSLEDALSEICVRNWQSFKADWVKETNNGNNRNGFRSGGNQAGGRPRDATIEILDRQLAELYADDARASEGDCGTAIARITTLL